MPWAATPPGSWANTIKAVTGSGLQVTPEAALRDRASPCPPGGHSPPLLEAEKEEQVCDGERRLPTMAGSLPLLLISLAPLTAHLGIRTPFFLFCFTDSLRNLSSASHGPRSSPAELSSSSQHLLRERKSSAPSHSSQPTLFTFEPPVSNHMQPALSTSAPQEYLYLHQCISRRAENAR